VVCETQVLVLYSTTMQLGLAFITNTILFITCFTFNVTSFLINTIHKIKQQPQPLKNQKCRPKSKILYSSSQNKGTDFDDANNENDKEYRNVPTQLLSNFLPKDKDDGNIANGADTSDPLAEIDFNAPKIQKKSLEELAAILDYELYEKEWFVTGIVNPIYFADDFEFQDPDVKIDGIEEYAKGVNKLFDQVSSRADIISTVVNTTIPDTITVTWRLSGKVNIGPGLSIKPYIVYTDFVVDPSGLIISQEDRFGLPGWDILLSAFFPFLIGKVTAAPAPEVEPRVVSKPSKNNFLSQFLDNFLPQNK